MTLLSIAVCLLAHVGTLHSGHTQQLTVKQVCILACVQNRSSQLQVKILLCINILTHILFSYLLHTAVEYQPSDFHDDRQTVLVHHSTETVSSSILLYVNLNSRFQDSQPIAHLEISSYLNQPAEVFFTQPDGTLNSTVDIMLKSSLDFSYCYDQLRNMNHTLYSVPIVVIPHNWFDPSVPANHQHTIRLTLHSLDENTLQDLLISYFWTESLNLFINKSGMYLYL